MLVLFVYGVLRAPKAVRYRESPVSVLSTLVGVRDASKPV